MLKLRYWILLLRYLPFMDNPVAQNNLGIMYENGLGAVPKNYSKGVKWYRKAAERGYAGAQYKLGHIYLNGEGLPRDELEAFKWYEKAAEQGSPQELNDLGVLNLPVVGHPKIFLKQLDYSINQPKEIALMLNIKLALCTQKVWGCQKMMCWPICG